MIVHSADQKPERFDNMMRRRAGLERALKRHGLWQPRWIETERIVAGRRSRRGPSKDYQAARKRWLSAVMRHNEFRIVD